MKPMKILFVPIKPREYPDHHQVATWTLKCKSWIWTTEKLIATEILQITNPVPTEIILDINWFFRDLDEGW